MQRVNDNCSKKINNYFLIEEFCLRGHHTRWGKVRFMSVTGVCKVGQGHQLTVRAQVNYSARFDTHSYHAAEIHILM